jgi:hypothetical protein
MYVYERERKMEKNEHNNVLSDYVNIELNKMSQCQPTSVYQIKEWKKISSEKKFSNKYKQCPIT